MGSALLTNDETSGNPQSRKKSCIFKMIGFWFLLLALILVIMIFVRKKIVSRDSQTILATARSFALFEVPESFSPYSMTQLFGKTVLAFWDQKHVREDGRALAVIALFSDGSWNDTEIGDLEKEFREKADQRLEENEFHVISKETVEWEENGKKYHFIVFTGQQRIDKELLEACSCYRFLSGEKGHFQVYTLGLESAFPKEAQIAFLKSVVPVGDSDSMP